MAEEGTSTAGISHSPAATGEGENATNDDGGFEAFSRLIAPIPTATVDDDEDGDAQSTSSSMKSFLNFLVSDSARPENRSSSGDAPRGDPAASRSSTSDERQLPPPAPPGKRSGCEAIGDKVDSSMYDFFYRIGTFFSYRPTTTIVVSLVIATLFALGMSQLTTENRPEKVRALRTLTLARRLAITCITHCPTLSSHSLSSLPFLSHSLSPSPHKKLWLPQNTQAEAEQTRFLSYFPPSSRFENVIATAKEANANMLTKGQLANVMKMHLMIESGASMYADETYTFVDLCTFAGGTCAGSSAAICSCLAVSVLKMWNYDLATLEADEDVVATLNDYGSREDLEGVLGAAVFDSVGRLVSAEAVSISYFLEDRSTVTNGNTVDPINESWEESVFLRTVRGDFSTLNLAYLSSRSFNGEITNSPHDEIL
jgi:hypothetical protein